MFHLDSIHYADTSDCLIPILLSSLHQSPCTIQSDDFPYVRYDLEIFLCMICASNSLLYDINLGATHTTILSIRGVTILIYLVRSTMDSVRRCVVLFKTVTVPTSDPKSEFLCQSSHCRTEPAGSPEPPRMPGISPTPLKHHISSILP